MFIPYKCYLISYIYTKTSSNDFLLLWISYVANSNILFQTKLLAYDHQNISFIFTESVLGKATKHKIVLLKS